MVGRTVFRDEASFDTCFARERSSLTQVLCALHRVALVWAEIGRVVLIGGPVADLAEMSYVSRETSEWPARANSPAVQLCEPPDIGTADTRLLGGLPSTAGLSSADRGEERRRRRGGETIERQPYRLSARFGMNWLACLVGTLKGGRSIPPPPPRPRPGRWRLRAPGGGGVTAGTHPPPPPHLSPAAQTTTRRPSPPPRPQVLRFDVCGWFCDFCSFERRLRELMNACSSF